MKCIYYYGKNNFDFSEVKERKCKENEIEIKTKILGLCGSDLHKFLKQTPDSNYLMTHILGHEICGVVSNIGSKVKNISVGDRVVVNPFNVPENLVDCESFSLCKEKIDIVGRNIDGGYSELIYLPKNCIYKLPNTISNEEAIFIDDIAVALHGIHYIEEYKINFKSVAIIGDGPLGILCYRLLKQLYPKNKTVLFSKNQEKINSLNIDSISFSSIDLYKEKFDVIIEAVGGKQSKTLNKSILIGNNNCLILCYGVYNFNYDARVNVRDLFYKQGMIKGINSYCNKFNDFENAIKLLSSGKLVVNDLITNRVDFDDSIEFINKYSTTKNNIKTVFEVNK